MGTSVRIPPSARGKEKQPKRGVRKGEGGEKFGEGVHHDQKIDAAGENASMGRR